MLGHATISQTMDTYSHVMPGMGDIAAEALESALKADCDDTYPRITL
jgi:integrase